MTKLGEVCKISASSDIINSNEVWLLNLDMVEQQTGRIIDYLFVKKNELSNSIVQFNTDNVLYSKLRPNLNKVVIPNCSGFATSEMLPLKPNTSILTKESRRFFLVSILEYQLEKGAMRTIAGNFLIVTGSLFQTKKASHIPYINTPRINARLREKQDA